MDIVELLLKVEEGNESPLKAYAQLKQHSKIVSEAINQVEQYALEEAEGYGEKTFEDHGFKFEVRSGSKRWDFSEIELWNNYNAGMKELEAKYKASYNAYEKGIQSVDEEGEVVPVPKVTFTKSSIIVKESK